MGLDVFVLKDVKYINVQELFYKDGACFLIDEYGNMYNEGQYYQLNIKEEYSKQNEGCSEYIVYHEFDKIFSFRAGSYGAYGYWRYKLANIMGYEEYQNTYIIENEQKPFNELLNFTDCDGVINSEVSKSLYIDFSMYYDIVQGQDESFVKLYTYFMNAFKIASEDDGIVVFG